jgi:RNA polymerase sigma factor (sigma-70 family)
MTATVLKLSLRASDVESVNSLLMELPVDQREVIELRLAGLTGREIAEAMERSVDAVKMLQLRAMKRLRAAALTQQTEESVK